MRSGCRLNGLAVLLAALALLTTPGFAAEQKSDAGLRKVWRVDIDGDGRPEVLSYSLALQGDRYHASLAIRGSRGPLWLKRWSMTVADLNELLREEGDIPASEWVERFFGGGLQYGAKLERRRLKAGDLDPQLIDDVARQAKMPASAVEKAILREKINLVFTYRGTWREDLIALVYVPELKRFVRYSPGPY
ncbi:MAG: hypothetical protein ACREEG_12770 [Phenylobacterium sp.]